MQPFNNQLPQNLANDYKLVLVPHADLNSRIIKIRKDFAEKFNVERPLTAFPEILLASFKQHSLTEARMINRFRIISMSTGAIKVELKDFSSLPSHSILLHVNTLSVGGLVKKIREDAQHLMKMNNENKPFFPYEFYFTVATRLKPWQYEKAWLEYENKHFTGKFIAGRMLLLKRKEGEFKYKPIENFEFLNQPIDIKQGVLF